MFPLASHIEFSVAADLAIARRQSGRATGAHVGAALAEHADLPGQEAIDDQQQVSLVLLRRDDRRLRGGRCDQGQARAEQRDATRRDARPP